MASSRYVIAEVEPQQRIHLLWSYQDHLTVDDMVGAHPHISWASRRRDAVFNGVCKGEGFQIQECFMHQPCARQFVGSSPRARKSQVRGP